MGLFVLFKQKDKDTGIKFTKDSIIISKTDEEFIRKLRNILPYGLLSFKEPFEGAEFGIVMCCGEKEVYCIKQQPVEVGREQADNLFLLQHLMIMDAYCRYIKMGFSGGYLASPYLKQRDTGLWEAGIAHFIFPQSGEFELKGKSSTNSYDTQFGIGASSMFNSFVKCLKDAFSKSNLTKPPYTGIDICPRSNLQNLAMYFMVLDSQVICLRANLRKDEDLGWDMLASGGIDKVYHMPSVPMTIQESDLVEAKGL
jgi:hypothetical protein